MRKTVLMGAVLGAVVLALIGGSIARADKGDNDRKGSSKGNLDGYQETPSISTAGRGDFRVDIDGTTIRFRLRYEGLEGGAVGAAHLHFGQRHTAGAVIAFLCGGGGKPACPASGTVEGTIVAADVIGPAAQGIATGQFDELVRAIRAGAVYVNVHTATYPGGEIRGQLRGRGKD
ncbi:MAG: CHRD domain-containing protein [Gaiella sp.]